MNFQVKWNRLRASMEILALDLSLSYRFPLAEIYMALYTFFLVIAAIPRSPIPMGLATYFIYLYFSTLLPKFITNILIARNIAFGFASEIEKGLLQTILTYPIKRADLFIIKILSCIIIPYLFFNSSLILATYILYPEVIAYFGFKIILFSLAVTGSCILFGALALAASIFIKRGGASLGIGIAIYFALEIISAAAMFFAGVSRRIEYTYVLFILNPLLALASHYVMQLPFIWTPQLSFYEALGYLILHYLISISILTGLTIYFTRRFEPV